MTQDFSFWKSPLHEYLNQRTQLLEFESFEDFCFKLLN